jgi:hypothetical protein
MTVSSALKSRVCCTPQPAKGSLRFARAASPYHPKAVRLVGVRSPQRGSHPSKTSPRQQPYRITAAVAFLSLPSCSARVPTEAGVLADRRVPRRATYIRCSLPWRAGPSRPEGRGSGSGPSCPEGLGVRNPPWALLGRGATPGAPKRSACRAPVRPSARRPEGCRLPGPESGVPLGSSARGSEEPRVPGPGEAELVRPGWNGGAGPPRRLGLPVPVRRCARCAEARRVRCPVGWGAVGPEGPLVPCPVELAFRCSEELRLPGPVELAFRCSEELRLPGPGGTGWPARRSVPVARSRWSGDSRAPKSAGFPAPARCGGRCPERRRVPNPVGSGPCPGRGRGALAGGTGFPVLRRAPVARSRWNWLAGAPKSSGCPVPVELAARCAEARRLPGPARSDARCAEARRLPDPGEVRRAMLRRAPCASPRVERSRSPSEEAGRPCPGWNWLGGAPKRAVCPAPRNWLGGAPKRAVCPAPLAGSPYPEGRGTGVRGRGFNAVMLRSAEADPHVTEHSAPPGAEAPELAA